MGSSVELIAKRIRSGRLHVYLRGDFVDIGSYGQVGRALAQLVQRGELLRLGHGIYARAQISPIDGKPAP